MARRTLVSAARSAAAHGGARLVDGPAGAGIDEMNNYR